MGPYSLIEIEAPFFKSRVSGPTLSKITNTYTVDNPDFLGLNQQLELSFSNLLAEDRKKIAYGLVEDLATHLKLDPAIEKLKAKIKYQVCGC